MDTHGINQVLTPTCTDDYQDVATSNLLDRSLLYNRDKKDLNIIIGRKAVPLTAVDGENIVKDNNNFISLNDDITVNTVTTLGDGQGLPWKSQSRLFTSETNHKIYLFFKQVEDASVKGFIGGEIMIVGNDTYGHYQISLSSTGSRLLKGATTDKDRARLVLCRFANDPDTFYYGIKIKSEDTANVYFTGWSDIEDSIKAPVFMEYGDSDLSEVVELDDDSDTGTKVEEPVTIPENVDLEFRYAPTTVAYGMSEDYWKVENAFKGQTNDMNFGKGYRYDNGRNTWTGLDLYTSVDYDYPIDGLTYNWQSNHTITFVDGGVHVTNDLSPNGRVDDVIGYVQIIMNNGTSGYLSYDCVADEPGTKLRLYAISTNMREKAEVVSEIDVKTVRGTYVFMGINKGEYYLAQTKPITFYGLTATTSSSAAKQSWIQDGNNSGYDLSGGVSIISTGNTSWYETNTAGNPGYIRFDETTDYPTTGKNAIKIHVKTKCTVTIGISAVNTNVELDLFADGNWAGRGWSSTATVNPANIGEVVFNWNGKETDLYGYSRKGPFNLAYIKISYDGSTLVADRVDEMENTGEDGTAHILRPTGLITKEALLNLAAKLRNNSSLQVEVDLSNCIMESRYTDWSNDDDLSKLFNYCVSIRSFYYPQGVTSSGYGTFMHCSFLREVHFNREMLWIGKNTWQPAFTGVFSGCRIKTLFIPNNIRGFAGYSLSESNIINLYLEEDTSLPTRLANSADNNPWPEWYKVKNALKVYVPPRNYQRFATATDTFGYYGVGSGNGYTGTDSSMFIRANDYIRNHCVEWTDYPTLQNPEKEIPYTD